MADFLKPGFAPQISPRVREGIEWHYKIDRFMDSHPLVAQSRARLFPKYRHYAAVLVDLFYDHLLATQWSQFSQVALPDFARGVYQNLEKNAEFFPPNMREVMPQMMADDWLCSYGTRDGMNYALYRVGLRSRRGPDLSGAFEEFSRQKSLYQAEFLEFFPQILALRTSTLNLVD